MKEAGVSIHFDDKNKKVCLCLKGKLSKIIYIEAVSNCQDQGRRNRGISLQHLPGVV